MKTLRLALLGLGAAVCLAADSGFALVQKTTLDGSGQGITADPDGTPRSEMPNLWFVEMSSPPLAEAGSVNPTKYLNKLKQEKQAFRQAAQQEGIQFTQRYAYDQLWNGLSLEVDPSQLLALATTPGVAGLYPILPVEAPPAVVPVDFDPGAQLDLFTAITMTGADQVQREGITGAGVKVGVIDTGVDYTHPDLGGGFGPGFKVEGGFDLVGDFYTGPGSLPFPDLDPRDCNGHGTHVSGIIAANGKVIGVAPGATLRAYKIFGCEGGTGTDVILAAMEMALQDGNQVINLSLGSPFQWPQYPTGRAADNLVNQGVVVVAAAGNNAAAGLFSMDTPGVGKKVISAASVENLKVHSRAAQVLGGATIGYLPLGNALPPPLGGSALVKDIGHGCNSDRSLFVGLQGKIAVAKRGRCALPEMVLNARNNSAVAVLIYNDSPGIFLDSLPAPGILFPAATLSMEDGSALAFRARFPTNLQWTTQFVETPNMNGGTISFFSSYGASPDLDLKPDISAPGGLIFSTLPISRGGYGLASGTSMSSPHVAGTVALLLEAKPHTSPQVVRDILQNSGTPRQWAANLASGLLEPIQHQGAGMVDIHAAVDASVKVIPGKLALGDTEGQPVTRSLTVQNEGATDADLNLTHQPALATRPGVFDVQVTPSFALVSFTPSPLHVPAGGSATLQVTFLQPDTLAEGGLFGGFVTLAPADGGREIRVPYLGMSGDYQKLVALNPTFTPFGNPLLINGSEFGPNLPITIVPANGETAPIVFHLDYSVRRIRLEVFDAVSGRSYGRLFEASYFPRNSGPDFFYFLTWTARDSNGVPVPAGDYTLRFSVEKPLGQDDNPADWEIWSSPPVTVVR